MTKQEFLELYGKSVYQIRLEIASKLWCANRGKDFDFCLPDANAFVNYLLKEDLKLLKQLYD
jgi:hypothetical protein